MSELILPKVTVILRGYETKQVLSVVEQLVGTKVNSIEVASNSPHVAESIAAAKKEFGSEVHVGAGTVTTVERAKAAIAAGAEFMLSPIMFSDEIFAEAKAAGVITVPSAFSPSEIQLMMDKGADIVKVFPAGQLGPDYIKAVQAPLGKLPLMVVGGVNADNVQSYFDKGATYAGIGSGIFDPKDIQECNSATLPSPSRTSRPRSTGSVSAQKQSRAARAALNQRRKTWQIWLSTAPWSPSSTRRASPASRSSAASPAS